MTRPDQRAVTSIDFGDAQTTFVDAMCRAGIVLPSRGLIADGRIHRADVRGHDGRLKRAGASYCLHLDGLPAGWFQRHSGGGELVKWRYRPGRRLSPAECAVAAAKAQEAKELRVRAQIAEHARAALTARRILERASPASPDHPYLRAKNIQPYGIRQIDDRLFIPVSSECGLQSGQWINPDGQKRFIRGGRTAGAWYAIGDIDPVGIILIGEGFATMASCHQAAGHPAIVAFNCGNLIPVAAAMRRAYPGAEIILCADDDWRTYDHRGLPSNPGRRHACRAAVAINARLAVPVWPGERTEHETDFNDLAARSGFRHIAWLIEGARHAGIVGTRPGDAWKTLPETPVVSHDAG